MTVGMHWLLAIPGSLVTVCFLAVLVFPGHFLTRVTRLQSGRILYTTGGKGKTIEAPPPSWDTRTISPLSAFKFKDTQIEPISKRLSYLHFHCSLLLTLFSGIKETDFDPQYPSWRFRQR